MNYITRLQQENADKQNVIRAARIEIEEFRLHLLSAKFQGLDVDGTRKDWIATGDVLRRLESIMQALPLE
jgi:hypothetical protein